MRKNGGKMEDIRGVVFSNTCVGGYSSDFAKNSLLEMQSQSGCNTVVFAISAIQRCVEDSKINYKHRYMPKDHEIIDIISFAKEIGLQTILKPEILCMDGNTQKEIAQCHKEESEDGFWFQEYTDYIMHYANIAKAAQSDMLVIGCELVELEHKERYWRNLICQIRTVYDGFLTYHANRCKEENVIWWDALDYISADGYYKNSDLTANIQRIQTIQKRYNKPFFFSEVGCKSCAGSAMEPENWKRQGKIDLEEQAEYFKQFIHTCQSHDTLSGMVVYNWWEDSKSSSNNGHNTNYNIFGKPVCDVLKQHWLAEIKEYV